MKYIIDIPKEYESDWVNKSSRLGFELCFPINETATNKKYHIPTGLKLESYTELDREAIENETWELAERIADMSYDDFISCFEGETEEYVYGLPYHEVKAKYDAWKKSKEEIHVGDEVEYECFGSVVRFVVVEIYNEVAYGFKYPFDHENIDDYCTVDKLKKTGRHFDEVEKLLKKMEED